MKFSFVPQTFFRIFFFLGSGSRSCAGSGSGSLEKVILYMLKISTKFGVAPQSFCENQNSVQNQDHDITLDFDTRPYTTYNIPTYTYDNLWTAWDIDMKFATPVKQSLPFNLDYFHDNWCPICDFMGFWIFWKKDVVALTSVKFELSSWNYPQIYYIHQGILVLNLAKIDWSVQIFSDLEFFENFFKTV